MCCLWGTQFPRRDKTTINTMKVKRNQLGKVGLSSRECCLLYWVHWCFHPRHQQECLAPMTYPREPGIGGVFRCRARKEKGWLLNSQSKGKPGKRGKLEVGKLIPMLIFVNKILLEHKNEHWCTVWLFSQYSITVWLQQTAWAAKPNTVHLWLCTEKFYSSLKEDLKDS